MGDVVFATSGTSGTAKGIVRTESSLLADAAALVAALPEIWATRPTVVASVPTDHLYGALWRVRVPAAAGSRVVGETVLSLEQLLEIRRREGRFLFVTTPSFLERVLEDPDSAELAGTFVDIVTSGSRLDESTARAALARWGVSPLEVYGTTEAGSVAFRRQQAGDLFTLFPFVTAEATSDGRLLVHSPFAGDQLLSDAVRFADGRRFALLGRTDRRVKILEEFVSLPDVEAALAAHPFVARVRVEAWGESLPRLGALIVPSSAALARLTTESPGTLVGELRRALLPQLGSRAWPRRIRFVRSLPVNDRGKTTAEDVRAVLQAPCREPVVLSWTPGADRLEARLVFPAEMECFRGHFPGFPVLPGVAQLYFVRHFARQAFADYPEAAVYKRLKFQKLVLPGREVVLTVSRTAPGVFAVELTGAGGRATSAVVEGVPQKEMP